MLGKDRLRGHSDVDSDPGSPTQEPWSLGEMLCPLWDAAVTSIKQGSQQVPHNIGVQI